MKVKEQSFGKLKNGEEASLFILTDNTITVKITNYGGIITAIETPDKDGKPGNIALGFDTLDRYIDDYYLKNNPYFGCLIGRYGNRIANGKFSLQGKSYTLVCNNEKNHLHGGNTGFDRKLWSADRIESHKGAGVELSYTSPHLEEGYPGNLAVTVTYILNERNELLIRYAAVTDQTTVLNLTNHTYFNLKGNKGDILDHHLTVRAEMYTKAEALIPTGEIASVENTPFDFRRSKKIGKDIARLPGGYDLNFVLDPQKTTLPVVAELREDSSGRKVELYTTQPGLQLYTGYHIPEFTIGGKKVYGRYSGVALEAQHFPDSPNHPGFPPVILHPGETYEHSTIYKFGTV